MQESMGAAVPRCRGQATMHDVCIITTLNVDSAVLCHRMISDHACMIMRMMLMINGVAQNDAETFSNQVSLESLETLETLG